MNNNDNRSAPHTGQCEHGERGWAILLGILGILGYYFACDMTHESYYSPAIIPKLTSIVIFLCACVCSYRTFKKTKCIFDLRECILFLFPKDVVVIIVLLAAYSAILPFLHFFTATSLFLIASILYLQKGSHMIRTIIISVLVTAALLLIFRYLFLVILP